MAPSPPFLAALVIPEGLPPGDCPAGNEVLEVTDKSAAEILGVALLGNILI